MTSPSLVASLGLSTTTETYSGESRPRAEVQESCGGEERGAAILLPVCLNHRNFPLEPQELATRTLLLWGEKDPYLEQGLVGAISSRFVPGRLEAHILPGVGHWIPQSNAEEMHQYMWTFLQDLLN